VKAYDRTIQHGLLVYVGILFVRTVVWVFQKEHVNQLWVLFF